MDEILNDFRLFGLDPKASREDLKEAYKRLVKQWHPDRLAQDMGNLKLAEEKIKEINIAYARLKVYLETPGSDTPGGSVRGRTTVQKRAMTAREFYDRAVELVKEGKYQEATEELGRAIKKDANYAEAYRYRGFLFSLLGFELRAEKDLKQAEALGIGIIPKDSRYEAKSTPSPEPANPTYPSGSVPSIEINLDVSLAEGLSPISAMALSAHQRTLAIGHGDGTISLWNMKTRRLFHTLGGPGSKVTGLKFSDDHQILFSGSEDGTVRLWNLSDGNFIKSLKTHQGAVTGLEVCSLRKLLITTGSDGAARVWDLKKTVLLRQLLSLEGPVSSMALNNTGEIALCGTHDGSIRFCHTLRGGLVKWLEGHSRAVSALAFTRDNRWFASASVDGQVRVWAFPSGDRPQVVAKAEQAVNGLTFWPNQPLLCGTSSDGQLRVWHRESGILTTAVQAHGNGPNQVLALAEGCFLTAGGDGAIRQWRGNVGLAGARSHPTGDR